MEKVSEISPEEIYIGFKTKPYNSEQHISTSAVQDICDNASSSKPLIEQSEEVQIISDSDDKRDSVASQTKKANVLEDIVELIELIGSCVTKDGTNPKEKYKDGFTYLEKLQTQFENFQKEASQKDEMIVALVVENNRLKAETDASNKEISKKCQQLEKLQQDYNKLKKEIDTEQISKKTVILTNATENLKSKAANLRHRFQQFLGEIETRKPIQEALTSLQAFQDDVELSLCRLELNLSLLAKCQKKIEEQLEYTETCFNKLNDMCIETGNSGNTIVVESQQQIDLIAQIVQDIMGNFTEKTKSSIEHVPQSKSHSFYGLNSNSIFVPELPYVKPFSTASNNQNDQSHNSPQQTKSPSDSISRPIISKNPYSSSLRPQQQPTSLGNLRGHHKNLLYKQYPHLIPDVQIKCKICGLTFFSSAQLKLHEDLVHLNQFSGSSEITILPSGPYKPYSQRETPTAIPIKPLQKNYHKNLWTLSQTILSRKPSMQSANPSSSSSNQNAQKRQRTDLFQSSNCSAVSIPCSVISSTNSFKNK